MGKGRFVDKTDYTPAKAVRMPSHDVERERDVLRARVAELEREIEHLNKVHELELDNLRLRLEGQVREMQNELRSAFPLAARLVSGFDRIIAQELEAAKAAVKRE